MSKLAIFGGAPVRERPFPSWPVFDGREERALTEVLRSGHWWQRSMEEEPNGPGSKVARFQRLFAEAHGARHGIACGTGTAALEVALKALGVGPGDEVIVPAYTFVATASAAMLIGATPVFCDICPETLNMDPGCFESLITDKTRAVIPVHFAGLAADLESITEIAARRGIAVIEDAAHGHGGSWNGRGLGTIGHAGTFSFQASKNMTAGEGGLITTDDSELAELCESYIWAGRTHGRPWYEHHRLGWNYRLTEFQGALLIEQLGRLSEQTERRLGNGLYLREQLAGIGGLRPLALPSYATRHAFHLFVFRFPEEEFLLSRDQFIRALNAEGIPCSGGYAHPLPRNPMFEATSPEYRSHESVCPYAEQACHEVIWLEQRLLLGTRQDMDDIVGAIARIHRHREEFTTHTAPLLRT